MKKLILTFSAGEGHNSAAKAIKQIYDKSGEFCEICDTLSFLSHHVSDAVGKIHARVYRHTPLVMNVGYSISEKYDALFDERSLFYKVMTHAGDKVYSYIREKEIDNVICVHPFPAVIITELRNKYALDLQLSFVATDYTCSPSVNASEADLYFIPHEALTDEFIREGIPREKIVASGIPVRQCFYTPRKKDKAREDLGLPADKKIITVCCGSMGCGPLEKLTKRLAEHADTDVYAAVICGSNKHLLEKLDPLASSKIRVVGYTKQMCEYMEACDVFMTKAGGISTTEASTKRVPMMLVDAVEGCELRNREFFASVDCAAMTNSNDQLVPACIRLLGDPERLGQLEANMAANFQKNAAQIIYDRLQQRATGR